MHPLMFNDFPAQEYSILITGGGWKGAPFNIREKGLIMIKTEA